MDNEGKGNLRSRRCCSQSTRNPSADFTCFVSSHFLPDQNGILSSSSTKKRLTLKSKRRSRWWWWTYQHRLLEFCRFHRTALRFWPQFSVVSLMNLNSFSVKGKLHWFSFFPIRQFLFPTIFFAQFLTFFFIHIHDTLLELKYSPTKFFFYFLFSPSGDPRVGMCQKKRVFFCILYFTTLHKSKQIT